ncbi:hypothetical protein N9K77_01630 [bacterium]|nr:hypothetical protein [bacterium]
MALFFLFQNHQKEAASFQETTKVLNQAAWEKRCTQISQKETRFFARIKEITQTLSQSFIGIIFIFFTFLLDDKINSYQDYYKCHCSS